MRPPLSDVGVRARGLANHLLPQDMLRRLARSSGSGVLVGALQAAGYWSAPSEGGPALSTVETIDAAIEHEAMRRLGVLAGWMGERRDAFAGVFEYEDRRVIRFWLRLLTSPEEARSTRRLAPGAWGLPRRLRKELAGSATLKDLVREIRRAGSPYADPLEDALREVDPGSLECALDRAYAERSLHAAERHGDPLLAWVREGIDLENAWDALAGGGSTFIEGGGHLSSGQHAMVTAEPSASRRRRLLGRVFARSALARVFDDPGIPTMALESHAQSERITHQRRAARIDPLGAAPILEFVMRLWAERAALRRINWGIAQGSPAEAIIGPIAGWP